MQFHKLIRQTKADIAGFSILCYRCPDGAGAHWKRRNLLHRVRINFGEPSVNLPAAGIAVDARPDSHIDKSAVRRSKCDVRIALEIASGNAAHYLIGCGIEQEDWQGTSKRIEHNVFVSDNLRVMRLTAGVDQCRKFQRFRVDNRSWCAASAASSDANREPRRQVNVFSIRG